MFELIFLGTSASVPSPERNQQSYLVVAGGRRFLIDCGEGTQRQLLRSGVGLRRPDRVLLTHGHLDHMLGLPGLLSTLGLQDKPETLVVNGGAETLGLVAGVFAALWGEGRAPVPLELTALSPGRVAAWDDLLLDCFPVAHSGTDSFGYVLTIPPRRHLLPERLAALNVPDGPVRKSIAAGEPVVLEDGRTIDPETVLGPPQPGTKLAIVGDAETTDGLADSIRGADALVIEATFLARDAETARRYGHLSATESATLAKEAGVGRLILSHISGRYPAEEILAEAQSIFPATVVAGDFDRFRI